MKTHDEEHDNPLTTPFVSYNEEIVLEDLSTHNESMHLRDVEKYILSTYRSHYEQNSGMSTIDMILSSSNLAEGFIKGNIMKYTHRCGKKGNFEDAKKDVFKIIHYALFWLNHLDEQRRKENT